MSKFIDKNFLLNNDKGKDLYFNYSQDMPIIDYHCHIPVKDIAEDTQFKNLTHIWLYGDHYKWRALRTAGIDENLITGDASDYDKFKAWAKIVPKTLGNPLYHWTHLELSRYFGINKLLNGDTADEIWENCNDQLKEEKLTARNIIRNMNVEVVCTTNDPTEDLHYHQQLASDDSFPVIVLPAFRADNAMNIDQSDDFKLYLRKLGTAANKSINSYDDLLSVLQDRHDFFHKNGCRLSDHGLEVIYDADFTLSEVRDIFNKAFNDKPITLEESNKFKSAILLELAKMDHASGWVQQFHLGAIRNNNSRMYRKLGADTGFDSMGDYNHAVPLARFLNSLDANDQLTKTILYNVNPKDNALFATMIGNFQDGRIPGKLQFGSGWWFLDQKDGIENQIRTLANMGLLSYFVGMLTDSRSFLSYPRHEYFRRVMCNMIGDDIEKGLIPDDMELVGSMISDISYYNAKNYFDFYQV
ncbi:MAG TPA: glucuronate isomerase [Balneolales bacterium]|nr:glucuronate isomerase [Balneolales bacterium]